MARSKSINSGKGSRKNTDANPEANGAPTPAAAADMSAVKAVTTGSTAAETAATGRHESMVASETRATIEPRKLEVVKSEPRKNVVPINVEDEIRRRAYEIYQQRGNMPGSESEDWLIAEREVRQRYHQQQHTA